MSIRCNESLFRGNPIVWIEDDSYSDGGYWAYADDGQHVAKTWREHPCGVCGECFPLGKAEVDPCLGVLPGVDNACCGHGHREESYVRFTSGVVLRGFTVEYTERWRRCHD